MVEIIYYFLLFVFMLYFVVCVFDGYVCYVLCVCFCVCLFLFCFVVLLLCVVVVLCGCG